MAAHTFGTASWWEISDECIGVKISYTLSEEKFRQLVDRFKKDIVSTKWNGIGKYWTIPIGAFPALEAFCRRYGLTLKKQTGFQDPLL